MTMATRRELLIGTGLLGLGLATDALPRVGGVAVPGTPDLATPAANLQAVVRMMASLNEEDVPWWFDGTIYGIVGDGEPRPLVKFEGMEIYWMRHLPDGAYELIGNTVTYFRDLATGQMLERWANPYTGRENVVTAATQGGGPGAGFNYSLNGIRYTKAIAHTPDQPLVLDWSFARGGGSPGGYTVSLCSHTVLNPWPKWMDMADRPGHVIWHASGAKLRSVAELPGEYRRRVEQDYPRLLTARPGAAA